MPTGWHIGRTVESRASARAALQPLHQQLLPSIHDPLWESDLSEEYFVFQLVGEGASVQVDRSLLASLVHLESGPLSEEEEIEAVRGSSSVTVLTFVRPRLGRRRARGHRL